VRAHLLASEKAERPGWRLFPAIDRAYVNERARRELGLRPEFDFAMS
jgi:hypothetical protein